MWNPKQRPILATAAKRSRPGSWVYKYNRTLSCGVAGAEASRVLGTEEALGAVGDRMVASPQLRAQGSASVPLDMRALASGVLAVVLFSVI